MKTLAYSDSTESVVARIISAGKLATPLFTERNELPFTHVLRVMYADGILNHTLNTKFYLNEVHIGRMLSQANIKSESLLMQYLQPSGDDESTLLIDVHTRTVGKEYGTKTKTFTVNGSDDNQDGDVIKVTEIPADGLQLSDTAKARITAMLEASYNTVAVSDIAEEVATINRKNAKLLEYAAARNAARNATQADDTKQDSKPEAKPKAKAKA